MKRMLCDDSCFVIVKDDRQYGLEDRDGNRLLPVEYDLIRAVTHIRDGVGFVLMKNGLFGYVEFGRREWLEEHTYGVVLGNPNGCALAFLPCVYPFMDVKRNGLVIGEGVFGEKDTVWFDFKSRTLHRNLIWCQNFVDFDSFWLKNDTERTPTLKRAGADEWVVFPKICGVELQREIQLDNAGVRCLLCSRERGDEDDETVWGRSYFLLLLFKNGWIETDTWETVTALYAALPGIADQIHRKSLEAFGAAGRMNYGKQNDPSIWV